ncbi:MAG TPA: hypothetical protein VH395_00235 [Jatrophihabitantaceae bacterium]
MPSGPGGGELPTEGEYPILTSEAIRTRADDGAKKFVVTFTARQGARPAARVVRPRAKSVVVEPPRRPAPRRELKRRSKVPLALALFAFALFLAIPILALIHRSDDGVDTGSKAGTAGSTKPAARSTPVATGPGAAERAAMVSWAQRSLSRSATIAADGATVAALRLAGFTGSLDFSELRLTPLATVDYVFEVPGSAPTTAPASTLVRGSLPLALFGGKQAASVRQVIPTGLADAQRRIQTNDAQQRSAGTQLVADPAVHVDGATRALLLSGAIDVRVENVLSQLARTGTIYVTDPTAEPAETRAGLPIRSIVITTPDDQHAQAVQNALDALTVPYQPSSIQTISPRKLRLTWQPSVAPAISMGGKS